MERPVLQAEALTKSYGRRRGVVDLSFEVRPGGVFGYLGPNGAGKTTTIRTALDLIRPTAGRIRLFGLDSRRGREEIHKRVGYLPGEITLYPRMTGRDLLVHLLHLRREADRAFAFELAERLDCDLDRRIGALSHGNRRKLALIQAFMHRPGLVILDEPTQGLDPLIQQEFHRLVRETREEGRTVFLSSHVLPEVERVCDRVGIIREGRLVAVEDVGDLMARALRSIEIQFAGPVPSEAFAGLPGIKDLSVDHHVVRATVEGSLDALIKASARFEVLTVQTHQPSLEEIFLSFYGPGAEEEEDREPGAPSEVGRAAG
ncbi:MAG: ABC transporter ATP-binding protein [Actinobacteria bacterium]|nr:ABC transporter ATP-binding protein [Actinomycetota bacterium]